MRWTGIAVLGAILLWQFAGVLLLVFASILIAVMLLAIAGLIRKYVPISQGGALLLACLTILFFVALLGFLLGTQLAAESAQLQKQLPKLLAGIGDELGIQHLDRRVAALAQSFASRDGLMGKITATTSFVVSGIASTALVLVAGVYFAVSPKMYRDGALRLVPPRGRDSAAQFMDTCARALTLWLVGQLATMAAVGLLFAIGLLALGIPSALALGFIAGVAEFIPYAGPILGAIPALLIALSMGQQEVIGVLILYVAIQAVEGNVLSPLIQRRAVDLPPVLTLFSIVAIGEVFGALGLLLASPLTLIGFIAVKQFYVRDTLKEKASLPGEIKKPIAEDAAQPTQSR
nr:AI-2E family transporter [Rhizomicrobium palustre]